MPKPAPRSRPRSGSKRPNPAIGAAMVTVKRKAPTKSTYFLTLDEDELENVLYNLSARPNCPNWYMPDEDLEPLLGAESALRGACKTFFMPRRAPDWFEFWGCCVLFEQAGCLLACADMLHSVALSTDNIASLDAKDFASRAKALRNLFFSSIRADDSPDAQAAYAKILKAVGARLHALRFEGEWRNWLPRLVARQCSALRKLEMESTFDGPAANERFWRAVGSQLEELDIVYNRRDLDDAPYDAHLEIAEIIHIRTNCTKLHALCVLAPFAANRTLVDTLAHYGRSLRYTLAHALTPQLAADLVDACPEARIRAILTDAPTAAAVIQSLGPKSDEMALHFDYDGMAEDTRDSAIRALRSDAKSCMGIKRLFSSCFLAVNAFAEAPLHELRTITLDFHGPCADENAILAFAKNTGSLVRASIHCRPVSVGSISRLVATNPQLSALELVIQPPPRNLNDVQDALNVRDAHTAAPYYASLVRSVALFDQLREIEIRLRDESRNHPLLTPAPVRHTAVADACVPLRNRKMFVVVASWLYLPNDEEYKQPASTIPPVP